MGAPTHWTPQGPTLNITCVWISFFRTGQRLASQDGQEAPVPVKGGAVLGDLRRPPPPPEWGRGARAGAAPREARRHVFIKQFAHHGAQSTSQEASDPCSGWPSAPADSSPPGRARGWASCGCCCSALWMRPALGPKPAILLSPGAASCLRVSQTEWGELSPSPAAVSSARNHPWEKHLLLEWPRAVGGLGVSCNSQNSYFQLYDFLVSYHLTLVFTYIGEQ